MDKQGRNNGELKDKRSNGHRNERSERDRPRKKHDSYDKQRSHSRRHRSRSRDRDRDDNRSHDRHRHRRRSYSYDNNKHYKDRERNNKSSSNIEDKKLSNNNNNNNDNNISNNSGNTSNTVNNNIGGSGPNNITNEFKMANNTNVVYHNSVNMDDDLQRQHSQALQIQAQQIEHLKAIENERKKQDNVSVNTGSVDQIEMLKAYREMFGESETAEMMNLDINEVKKVGLDNIINKMEKMRDEQIKLREKQEMDRKAAEFASSINTATTITTNNNNIVTSTSTFLPGANINKPPPSGVSENACVFAGDLHPLVSRTDLVSVFSHVGEVQWVQLFDCHKQMNRPFNFAFIYFKKNNDAQNAINQLNFTKFYGVPCRLMWKQEKNAVKWTDSNIIVKNLPPNTDSQILHGIFCKYGSILSSKVKTNENGKTLPYGYVQFATKESAILAISEADKGKILLNGQTLIAEWFRSRDDRSFRQIYVKNIPVSWNDTKLIQLFEAQTMGKIGSVTIKNGTNGKWACISFNEPHHAARAIEQLNGCPTGDKDSPILSVSRFMFKQDRNDLNNLTGFNNNNHNNNNSNNNYNGMSTYGPPTHMSGTQRVESCYSIYIGNIPIQLTEDHLKQLFEPFGTVVSAAVVQKTENYKYGFVNFEQPQDAAKALVTMNGKQLGGKTLQIKPANTDQTKVDAIQQATQLFLQSATLTQQQQLNQHYSNQYYQQPLSIQSQQHWQQQQYLQQHQQIQHQQQYLQQQQQMQQQPQTQTINNNNSNDSINQQQTMSNEEALKILTDKNGKKIWKVQYGEDWHEYDSKLAVLVEQLRINEQIQITLADSEYIFTRISQNEAIQQNPKTKTKRRVIRVYSK